MSADPPAQTDVVVDCTPKRIAAKNVGAYRARGVKFILQGGEKHGTTGHSFVAESNYGTALGCDSTRVVSCTTTSVVRTLVALHAVKELMADPGESIARTNATLGIEPALV